MEIVMQKFCAMIVVILATPIENYDQHNCSPSSCRVYANVKYNWLTDTWHTGLVDTINKLSCHFVALSYWHYVSHFYSISTGIPSRFSTRTWNFKGNTGIGIKRHNGWTGERVVLRYNVPRQSWLPNLKQPYTAQLPWAVHDHRGHLHYWLLFCMLA